MAQLEGGERKSGARRGEMMRRFRVIGNDSAKLRFSRMGIRENLTVTFPLYVTLRRADGRPRGGGGGRRTERRNRTETEKGTEKSGEEERRGGITEEEERYGRKGRRKGGEQRV